MSNKACALLNAVTAVNNGLSSALQYPAGYPTDNRSLHCSLTGTGALTATILIDVSNDGVNWISPGLATISLSGSGSVQEGTMINVPWAFIKANLTALTGTGATVTVTLGL